MNIVSIATKQLDTPKNLIRGIVTSTCERIKMFSQDSHSKAAHLYSNNAGDTIHIVQPANKLADDRVQPGAEASAGDNGRVHLIGLEIHPLPRPGTPEVSAPRTGLMNNNLQSVMHKISPKKNHSEVFNSLFTGLTFCVTVSSGLTKYCLGEHVVGRKVSFGTSVSGWIRIKFGWKR